MKITIKLFASLRDLLPPAARQHGIEIDIPPEATPYQIIDQFHVPRPMAHLMLHNGVYLLPRMRDQAILQEGDVLAVWPPIAGG
jgi:molybdopterin converting factor small subunit